jgi:2-polyprenyl-3-methyl-5-hydroxy-6-metoxy-1,4-benzoquinol methylase
MRFSDPATARIYSDRDVDPSWVDWCREALDPRGKVIVDIGCGGGIYSRAFLKCGAKTVYGIDSSAQYVDEAKRSSPDAIFKVAQCDDTGLESGLADIVFERALIHHLHGSELTENAREMRRLLGSNGVALVQDRTQEDVIAFDDRFWMRRELMRMFPRLVDYEASRRPKAAEYLHILQEAGFDRVEVEVHAETRKVYRTREELAEELMARKGKSILFELSDRELGKYIDRITSIAPSSEIVECDQWTLWKAIQQGAPGAHLTAVQSAGG